MVDAAVEVFTAGDSTDDEDDDDADEPIGTLTVSVLAKEALKSIMKSR